MNIANRDADSALYNEVTVALSAEVTKARGYNPKPPKTLNETTSQKTQNPASSNNSGVMEPKQPTATHTKVAQPPKPLPVSANPRASTDAVATAAPPPKAVKPPSNESQNASPSARTPMPSSTNTGTRIAAPSGQTESSKPKDTTIPAKDFMHFQQTGHTTPGQYAKTPQTGKISSGNLQTFKQPGSLNAGNFQKFQQGNFGGKTAEQISGAGVSQGIKNLGQYQAQQAVAAGTHRIKQAWNKKKFGMGQKINQLHGAMQDAAQHRNAKQAQKISRQINVTRQQMKVGDASLAKFIQHSLAVVDKNK